MQAFDKLVQAVVETFTSRQWHGMRANCRCIYALVIILSIIGPNLLLAAQAADVRQKPSLVLLIVADQFSYNYLSRFQEHFGTGGFQWLQDHGACFTNCKFSDATTQSAVGHSIISTGAYPWSTGIISDQWYEPGHGKIVAATSDDQAQEIGGNGTGGGTRLLTGATVGDQMKLATNGRSKVISVSLDQSSALLLAGRLATNAYWWEQRTGTFVTSSQYGHELPSWVQAFNNQRYSEKFVGKQWQRLLPEAQYTAATRDDYQYERSIAGDGRQFPHVLGGGGAGSTPGDQFYSSFAMTPWANDMLLDFSKEAIERETLGRHSDPDLLAISFSAGEYLGNSFGPYSQESEDLCLRLDQSLAGLLQYIDQKIGLSNCLIVFSADHGSAAIPEFLKERGGDGGRIDPKVFKTLLNSALVSRLGAGEWIEAFEPPNLYLNAATISKQNYRQPDVEALAAKLVHAVPGIADAYAAFQFYTNQLPSGPLLDAVRKSYYWGRSGELYVIAKPGFIFDSEITGTRSGSPYNYDCQVPLMISGPGVQTGRYAQACSPADIAATMATVLGIDAPANCEGRSLSECLPASAQAQASSGQSSDSASYTTVSPSNTVKKHRSGD